MDYLKRREAELRPIARELLGRIQAGIEDGDQFESVAYQWRRPTDRWGSIEPIQQTVETYGKLGVILRLIRSHVKAQPFQDDDLEMLQIILNEYIEEVIAVSDPLDREKRRRMSEAQEEPPWGKKLPRFGDTSWLVLKTPAARWAAEQLMRYLDSFREEPRLVHVNPIGVCTFCEGIFLKRKSHQVYCSPKCRHASWRHKKLEDDPRYYAEKMKEIRKREPKEPD